MAVIVPTNRIVFGTYSIPLIINATSSQKTTAPVLIMTAHLALGRPATSRLSATIPIINPSKRAGILICTSPSIGVAAPMHAKINDV